MKFSVLKSDSKTQARTGVINTPSGKVFTPCFIPDATYGAVKHLSALDLKEICLQMILGNSYHLWLRPGFEVIKKAGGLKKFMGWPRPLLTDSGGWQVFSLVYQKKMGRVGNMGVEFRDHLTGAKHFFTPAESIKIQLNLGADILMCLDYPIAPKGSKKDNKLSVKLTTKWAKESLEAFQKSKNSKNKMLLSIIQGANNKKLRKINFQELEAISCFPGYGFGGPPENNEILAYTASLIPNNRLRYLMGGGPPKQIVQAVSMGWDLFDCVIPTRNARHGTIYTFSGKLNLKKSQYRLDQASLDKNCPCLTCQTYTRSYLHHLLRVKEPLASRLLTIHNLTFYMRLMAWIRKSIEENKFREVQTWAKKYY
ncbi:MAG: tRNA guanosine(34) transglycosylase Tgt [Candidatus Shapirobacteria bacterium]